ncbi:unnamed protein product [Cuscuta epithymum]|uniref:RING-type E3 ubiquitin transferase n=1 Tax=Cuscuta epithymum TaxID=186058 RepID=A0AAV0G5G1_9ASTE|nr:unnamed protein product [Cuscuta epithymum]
MSGVPLADCECAVELETDVVDDPRSMVRICVAGDSGYVKTWWRSVKRGHEELLYRIEEYADMRDAGLANIDLEKMLGGGSEEEEEELAHLITDKVLSPALEPAVCRDQLKFLVVDTIIPRARKLLSAELLLINHTNKCSRLFLISISVIVNLDTILLGGDLCKILKQAEQLQDKYNPSSQMPLPIIVPHGYKYLDYGEEADRCSICLEHFEVPSKLLLIRLQCLEEILYNPEHYQERPGAALLLPCKHIFHPSCILNWILKKRTPPVASCPQCRFLIPPFTRMLSILHMFPLKVTPGMEM